MIEAIHLRFLLILMALGAVISLYFAPTSQADPAQDMLHDASLFCMWVRQDPTPRGVVNAVQEFVNQGVSQQITVNTVTFAVINVCPEYMLLVKQTAGMVAPRQHV